VRLDDDNVRTNVSYNDALERLIADEGERVQGLAWLHEHSCAYFQKLNTYLALPIIVLSTLSGAISASSTALFTNQKLASVGIGGVSIFVGVLSTVQSYFGFARRAENHRLSGVACSKLNHFITIEMSLPRRERMIAHDLLKIVREQTGRLLETAPSIPDHVVKEFQCRFLEKYKHIAIPDIANGLRAIKLAPSGGYASPSHQGRSRSSEVATPLPPGRPPAASFLNSQELNVKESVLLPPMLPPSPPDLESGTEPGASASKN